MPSRTIDPNQVLVVMIGSGGKIPVQIDDNGRTVVDLTLAPGSIRRLADDLETWKKSPDDHTELNRRVGAAWVKAHQVALAESSLVLVATNALAGGNKPPEVGGKLRVQATVILPDGQERHIVPWKQGSMMIRRIAPLPRDHPSIQPGIPGGH